ncbi:hypothetical protein LZ31DRAFT_254369, partial [Colletotrichum somersetense]
MSDADENTRAAAVFSFWIPCASSLLFHYSKMDCSLLCGGGITLSGALFFASISGELCYFLLGSGMTRSIGFSRAGFLDLVKRGIPLEGRKEGLYRKGNAQDVERCSKGGRARLVRSCGTKPARRNAIYDMFISKSVFFKKKGNYGNPLPCQVTQMQWQLAMHAWGA